MNLGCLVDIMVYKMEGIPTYLPLKSAEKSRFIARNLLSKRVYIIHSVKSREINPALPLARSLLQAPVNVSTGHSGRVILGFGGSDG